MSDTSGGYLIGSGYSYCDSAETRTLVVEIKWDKNLLPDPLLASDSRRATTNAYYESAGSCDNGNRRSYYARTYFTVNDSHHDTTPRHITTCE